MAGLVLRLVAGTPLPSAYGVFTRGGEDGDEGPFRECLAGDPSGEASPSRRGDTRSAEPSGERAGERDVSASGERSSVHSPKRVGEAERVGERVGEAG